MPFFILIMLSCFALCVLFLVFLIPRLKKRAQQPIYAEGPDWHLKKQGTPTMGGVGFLLGILICALAICPYLFQIGKKETALSLLLNLCFAVLNCAVGIFDDLKKIQKKQNEGLTPAQKLIYQFIICVLYLSARAKFLGVNTTLSLFSHKLDLGFFFYPIMLFVMLGIINCANLTDGIDALASSVALAIGVAVFLFSFSLDTDAPIIGALMIGATLAFLLFNLNPARIFMGDSGSLLLGALAVSACFSLGQPLWILAVGFVYVIEGFSVVIQVITYKVSKKRVFKMAPLHHHMELSGVHENMIAYFGFLVTLLSSLALYFAK